MAECNTCGGYLSIEDKIRLSMKCDANGNVVWQGALLNQTELVDLISDGHTKAWFKPTIADCRVRDVNNKDVIWWDMMVGKDQRGAEQSSGVIIQYAVYEITACQTNFFYTGCAVGDIFPCRTVKTCDANNKVKRVLGNHLTQPDPTTRPVEGIFITNRFMKCAPFTYVKPEMVYAVLNHITYAGGFLFDGNGTTTMGIWENGGSPLLRMHAGTSSVDNANLPLNTVGLIRALFNGAGSKFQINRTAVASGNPGAGDAGGFTVGKPGAAGSNYANASYNEIILRDVIDAPLLQDQISTFLEQAHSITPAFPSGASVNMFITQPETPADVYIYTKSDTGANIYVSWGDGSVEKLVCDGTKKTHRHIYITGSQKVPLKIGGELDKLKEFYSSDVKLSVDVTEFGKCANLEILNFNGGHILECYGDISVNTKLKEFWAAYPSTVHAVGIHGNLDLCTVIEVFEAQGIDGNMHVTNVTGNFANLTKMKQWCAGTKVGGDISNCIDFEYFSWGYQIGDNPATSVTQADQLTARIWGDISNFTKLWFIAWNGGAATVTGSTALLAAMENFQYVPPLLTKPATIAHMTKLSQFRPPATWQLTEAEVNQYLADIWANREVVRVYLKNTDGTTYGKGYRNIDLTFNALSAAPTGQGITDKANLQATISPAVPGNGVAWTIATN